MPFANLSTLINLQNATNKAMGYEPMPNPSSSNHCFGTANTAPELHGQIRPEDELGALNAAHAMKGAEQKFDDEAQDNDSWKKRAGGSDDFSKKEVDANFDKMTEKEHGKQKALYQAAKSQWKKSGDGMIAKSYVDGFDSHPDDTVVE